MRCSDIILEFNVIKCNGRQDTESMKILVCMKQVPAGTKVDIDPETGAMKRMSGATRTNPYDLFALETALRIDAAGAPAALPWRAPKPASAPSASKTSSPQASIV